MSKNKKLPDHNWPSVYYMTTASAVPGEPVGQLREQDRDGSNEEPARCLTLKDAISNASGDDAGFRQDGIVAVYKLVEIVEVTYDQRRISHKIKGAPR